MSDTLKIVLAGCGGISDLWFKALTLIPDISVVGLVDIQSEAAARRKEQYNLATTRIGTDIDEMLASERPDIVFDCTIPAARATVVQAALRHGCHVLSEKPMATSMEEASALIDSATQARRLFAVMQNRRYDSRIRALRDFLQAGNIGDVTTIHGDFFIGAHFGGFRDEMNHVLLLDMAIHSFDQARLISGANPISVSCQEWNPHGSWYKHGASAVALFEMSGNIAYTYRGSWCAEGLSTSWECDWRIIGTKGTVLWNGDNIVRAQRTSGTEGFIRPLEDLPITLPVPDTESTHTKCIRSFIECVRSGQVPETICTENIHSLAMVFGAIASAESNKRIPITV